MTDLINMDEPGAEHPDGMEFVNMTPDEVGDFIEDHFRFRPDALYYRTVQGARYWRVAMGKEERE